MLLVAFALCILIDINPGVEGRCEIGCLEIYEPLCGTDGLTSSASPITFIFLANDVVIIFRQDV
jgi:hypothetical protein